jgi:hypothetical protein
MTSSSYTLLEKSQTFRILNSKSNLSCYTMIILGHHKMSHVDSFGISHSAICISTYHLKLQDFYRHTPYILGHLTYIPNQSYYCYALVPLTERLKCFFPLPVSKSSSSSNEMVPFNKPGLNHRRHMPELVTLPWEHSDSSGTRCRFL